MKPAASTDVGVTSTPRVGLATRALSRAATGIVPSSERTPHRVRLHRLLAPTCWRSCMEGEGVGVSGHCSLLASASGAHERRTRMSPRRRAAAASCTCPPTRANRAESGTRTQRQRPRLYLPACLSPSGCAPPASAQPPAYISHYLSARTRSVHPTRPFGTHTVHRTRPFSTPRVHPNRLSRTPAACIQCAHPICPRPITPSAKDPLTCPPTSTPPA